MPGPHGLHEKDAAAACDLYDLCGFGCVDRKRLLTQDGLAGLGREITRRSAMEPDTPMGIDIETDPLLFFPMIYWPVSTDVQPLSPETAENVVMQISGVIKFGAPMYNKGDARGCARLYRQTALSIARDASVTSQEIRDILRDAVAKGDEIARDAAETDPMGGEEDQATQERVAWALRRGLDRVVDLIMDPPTDEPTVFRPSSTEHSNQPDEKMGDDSEGSKSAAPRTPTITAETAALFDFAKTPDLAGRWRSLNDGVMGGVSDGVMRMRMSDSGESHATFEGTVRLENNGGFSSVRTSFGSGIDLSQFSGFYLDVRPGDETSAGKEYLLVVKDDEAMTTFCMCLACHHRWKQ